ncbi:MAG: hypothetical protein RLZZ200_3098 [Pseudomonadota bacterium]|jgi:DedD protein
METRIKERLTGALILVALMVIVVPEFLSGHSPRRAAEAVPAARPASEGPPLVTYQMPLDGSAEQPTGQAALNVQSMQSSDRLPAPTAAPAPAPAPVTAESRVMTPPPSAPVESPPVPEAEPVSPPAVKKTPPKPEAKPVAADKKGWFVQLGVFSKHQNAESMVRQAARKGHAAQISGGGSTWRVRVGPLPDRAAAQGLRKRLAEEGLAGTLVAP